MASSRAAGPGRRKRSGLGLMVCGLLVAAVVCAAYATDALEGLELRALDARFDVRGKQAPPDDVVFVAIDAATLRGLHQTFPFPRRLHARVLERIAKAKPLAVGYDVEFTGQTDRNDDVALALAVADTPHPVLAATEVNERGETRIFGGEKVLRAIGARAAHAGTPVDAGAVIRRLHYEVDGLKTFPIAVAEAASRHRIARGDLGGDSPWIDFYGGPGSIRTIPFLQVLRGHAPAALFRGKLVVIGPSREIEPHPTSTSGSMGGGEIQAAAAATALHGFPLADSSKGLDLLLILAASLLPAAAGAGLRRGGVLAVGAALAVVLAVAAQVAFNHGTVLPVVYPAIALVTSTVIAVAWDSVRAA